MKVNATLMRVLLAGALVASPASADVMNQGTILIGGATYYAQNASRDWSLTVKGTPSCLYRFEVRPGDHWLAEAANQRTTAERSEVEGPTDVGNVARFRAPVWTAYDFKIEPGPPSSERWVVLGDWHVQPDPEDTAGLSSPWQIELLAGDILAFDTRASREKPIVDQAPENYLWRSPAPIRRGVWHRLVSVAVFDWRPDGVGQTTVWLDGARIVEYEGPFGYNTTKPPYFKFGIYRPSSPETLVVDYANVVTSRESLRNLIDAPPPRCGDAGAPP